MKVFEINFELGCVVVVAENINRAKVVFSQNYPSFKIREVVEIVSEALYTIPE